MSSTLLVVKNTISICERRLNVENEIVPLKWIIINQKMFHVKRNAKTDLNTR